MLFIIYSVAFAPIELLNKRYYFSFGVNCLLFIRLQRSFGHLVLFIIYSVAFAPIVVIHKKVPMPINRHRDE